MATSRDSLIIELLHPNGVNVSTPSFERHISNMNLTEEEAAMVCEALSGESFLLYDVVSKALWNEDRHMLYSAVRSYEYCESILDATKKTPSKVVLNSWTSAYEGITPSNTLSRRKDPLSDAAYDRIASQIKARVLINKMTLNNHELVFSELDSMEIVVLPLIKNEVEIEKALPIIMGAWEAAGHESGYKKFGVNEVLDIAALISEVPDAGELIVANVAERDHYDSMLVREVIKNKSKALSSGML